MKLSVVIPVYNEEKTIQELVKRVVEAKPLDKEIIIVEDGSKDHTVSLLKELEKAYPTIKVIYKSENKGKGDSLKIGFKATTGDYVIVQDADLEYDPKDYEKLLTVLAESHVDVVYGSRFSGAYKDMSSMHFFGNHLLTLITNLLYGVKLTDMETCYKLLPGKFVRSIDIKSPRFDFEPEITAKILKSGMKIIEVPISYAGRTHSAGKKITWKDGFAAIKSLIKFRFSD
jgi:glycosyltransferase involved in cell wall biosynthesis